MNHTGPLYYRKKNIIKVEIKIKSTISSRPTSLLHKELVVLVHDCLPCGGLPLGYVGLRLDPPGPTGFWGAAVVPMWYPGCRDTEAVVGGWYCVSGCAGLSMLTWDVPVGPAH